MVPPSPNAPPSASFGLFSSAISAPPPHPPSLPLYSHSHPTGDISLPLSAGMKPFPAPLFALSLSSFYVCLLPAVSLNSLLPFPLYIHPPPTPTCSHHCVAPIYGFITAAIQGRRKGERCKVRQIERDSKGRDTGNNERRARERKRIHTKDLLKRTTI